MKKEKLKNYFSNIILIWLAFLFYKIFFYYKNFLRQETITAIFYLSLAYTLLGFLFYFLTPSAKIQKSRGRNVFSLIKKLFKKQKPSKQETISLLFIFVKIFFLPIMINFVFGNFSSIKNQILNFNNFPNLSFIDSFNLIVFPFLLALIFLIDTLWFSFGYSIESKKLKNKVRSVEPTILGWTVALICYPPFNGFATKYLNWYASESVLFFTPTITFIMRILIILFLGIYVSATLSLGAKCSNLTNRGIVSTGAYSIVRHPAYISKNISWWLMIIPVLSIPAILSMGTWSIIYHLRTITEERHLSHDPDYIIYKNKVKYRYIPGVY
ncbi:MAG: methyltransferase [Candidatus Pacearchaeota archaeon]|jgi:protein-S-isoprenylcysteine O-methyltransferase Ste14